VLLDIDTNETLLTGLSMPRSPRWHDGQLWLLESGRGAIGRVDLRTRRFEPIATLPGFTRGLAFAGPFAFVGVSQVRESATFSGIPLTRALSERTCGVWVVDSRNGAIVAFLRFEQAVQEIFAVAVLPGLRFPDVINDDAQLMGFSFALPDAALKEVQIPVATEHAEGHQQQGIAHHQAGEVEAAAAAFRRALGLQPDFLPARFNLGVTLNDLEQFDAAIAELERVVADEAAHANAHRALGFAHSQRREIDTAIGHLERAVAIRPDFAEAHLSLAMLLLMQGRYQAGWAAFDWRWKGPGLHALRARDPPALGRHAAARRYAADPYRAGRGGCHPMLSLPARGRRALPAPAAGRPAGAAPAAGRGGGEPDLPYRGQLRGRRVRRLPADHEPAAGARDPQ